VLERLLPAAARARLLDRDRLVERAIRLAVSTKPAEGFAAMEPLDREAVALARLAGYSAADVIATLGIDVDEAKRSMVRGLRSAGSVVPA
jgi:DNA-directed RNA polymerase specialized sigma24 family protein